MYSLNSHEIDSLFKICITAFSEFDAEVVANLTEKQITSISTEYGIDIARTRGVIDNANRILEEEIRFMIYPELIVGMLFLPTMSDNEAIEIVGAERYSDYTGYSSTFCFSGDYANKSEIDSIGRRKTRIVAIDAVRKPGKRQYEVDCLLREINKAFCGFLDQLKHQLHIDARGVNDVYEDQGTSHEATTVSQESKYGKPENHDKSNQQEEMNKLLDCYGNTAVATGNWECGAYGGDPQVKAILQWIKQVIMIQLYLGLNNITTVESTLNNCTFTTVG